MSLKELPPSQWASTLEEFGREHRAWLATVEHVASDGTRDMWVPNRPLSGVFAERHRDSVAVRIDLASDASGASSLRIDDPVAVRVEVERTGPPSALEIDDREGGRTRVAFRVHPPAEMLDGIAPGEV
jgi:hypothetical protein